VILAGKAASSYTTAKSIIQLTHDMAAMINHDARIGDRLKLVFIPNYSVSAAEIIMPAADLSEQISTAGTEASGTGNMKLAMNGALTIGTDDGANIEIREAVGDENIFIFGLRTQEVEALKRSAYSASDTMHANDALKSALALITSGYFCPDAPGRYQALVDTLIGHGNDHYLLLADYATYVATQLDVDAVYRQPQQWNARAIRNVAGMGIFSSERAIREYADKIWNIPTP
jgi:starch phosphorylase